MAFTRSPEAVASIEDRIAAARFTDATVVSVRFRTDPAVVADLLPPGLEPADDPVARADVLSVGASNCVGPFDGGGLYVRSRHGDRHGAYCLSMPMSTDAAVRWGRATLGEPKKLAAVTLDRDGRTVRGRIDREETLVAIDATFTAQADPEPATGTVFHYKFQPAVDGSGFTAPPALVAVTNEGDPEHVETGTADLRLGTTPHDPLGHLPVEAVLGARYAETAITVRAAVVTTVNPEAFTPYAYGVGMDDWLTLAAE